MANISLRTTSSLLSNLPKRYASAAAAAAPKETKRPLAKEPVRVTKLDNGIVAASLENHSPITRLAAVFNVGARDETHEETGATHALRVFAPLATRNYTVFGVSRNLDQIGAQLSVTSTRETLTYLLECSRPNFARAVDIFGEIISRPQFRHWEIDEARPRLNFDLDVYDESPELRLVDLIHRASFRNGLSNPLYAPRFNVGNIDGELLNSFRSKHFTNNRVTLVGLGLKHEDLVRNTELVRLAAGSASFARQKPKFISSEIREDNDAELVHAAIGLEGASISSKELLSSGIISHAFGASANRIKHSSGSSKLAKVALSQASQPAVASSFNANYSDTGLFGFHVVANKNDVGKVVKGVFGEFQKSAKNGLTNDEITRAKNSFKAALSFNLESSNSLIDSIAVSPEHANTYANASELLKAVDGVSANDVNAVLKRLASSKPSLAAVGDLSNLPRVDELSA